MDRLHKKCFAFSTVLHGLLLLIVVFGSAFFVAKEKKEILPVVRVVPTRLIDGALAGGGGNPNIKPSDAQQKGDTLKPVPTPPAPPPKAPEKKAVKKPEPAPEPPAVAKKAPTKSPKDTREKARELEKPIPSVDAPLVLVPATKESREARERQARAAEDRARAEAGQRIAKQLSGIEQRLRTGFAQGTQVEVWGTGGEAYADYGATVKAFYDDAWEVSNTTSDDDSTARVTVIIHRSGKVISAKLVRPSGNALLDNSVRRALLKVKFIAPFPAGAKEEERTYNLNFNLKAKRLLG